jgi:molybdenum cofactor cytidylyltransferase
MGAPKALLPAPDGRTFVARIAVTLAAAGLDEVVIVTGAEHDAIAAAIRREASHVAARFARNPDPVRGQLSSLWTAMDALQAPAEGLLVTLVDVPMIDVATVSRVIDVWTERRAAIVRPAIGDRHGHPVIFDRSVFAELRAASLTEGAKAVVRAHEADLINVPVADEGCILDVDTRADYDSLRRPT